MLKIKIEIKNTTYHQHSRHIKHEKSGHRDKTGNEKRHQLKDIGTAVTV